MELYLPPFLLLAIGFPPFFYYWLLTPFFFYWQLAPIGPIDCGVGSIGPIELPINRFGGRYVILFDLSTLDSRGTFGLTRKLKAWHSECQAFNFLGSTYE